MERLWTIRELASAVRRALADGAYPGQRSGRVRGVPDARTIRYYTTLGLLDRPAKMRGRTAFYSRRHLLQLLAIKRLQAQGKSLVEVQADLAGVGDSTLEELSALPDGFWERLEEQGDDSVEAAKATDARADFWTATPMVKAATVGATSPRTTEVAAALHVKVLDDVTLVMEGVDAEELDAETLSKLQPALEHLQRVLKQTGLMNTKGSRDDTNS